MPKKFFSTPFVTETEDENEYVENEVEGYHNNLRPVDLTRFNRDEGHIYESIEHELDLDELEEQDSDDVVRELSDLGPTDDEWVADVFNDSLGG